MSFLAGWTAIAITAAVTVPPLVALYFLKLRRQAVPVSTTMLWRRAVEDLQVNAPFQRIRNNLLLWLQLLILLLAAFALGKPIFEARQSDKDTLVLLLDNSASMNVEEAERQTRLDVAKRQARTAIDNMPDGGRAMIISFADRADIVSAFDTDKQALKAKIDEIEPTESTTRLTEGIALAEAYMQNLIIAGDQKGQDIEVKSSAGPARVMILTDGNIADAATLTVKNLPTDNIEVVGIGDRTDNVGIVGMDATRRYEHPETLEVFAMVRNFGDSKVTLDAHLYINDDHVDVQTMTLEPGHLPPADKPDSADTGAAVVDSALPAGSVASVAFDDVQYEGSGIVEVRLQVDDALAADNKAWTVIPPPRNVAVLLVSEGDVFLQRLLPTLPISLETVTPAEYEQASEDDITVGGRSKYDVVILENHSTDRLPPGSYLFLGGVPKIDGVSAGGLIKDEVIFNWDDTHAVLRYVAVDTIHVFQWLRLNLPSSAQVIMEGESSPVMALLYQDGRQYLISAFGLIANDDVTGEPMLNTDWVVKAHFPIFVYNAIQYLADAITPSGQRSIQPGEPMEFPVEKGVTTVRIRRPDGFVDRIDTGEQPTVTYARTRRAGIYTADPVPEARAKVAVNLFSDAESDIAPRRKLTLSGEQVSAEQGIRRVNKPFWPWLLVAMVVVLAIEWAIYSKRVFV